MTVSAYSARELAEPCSHQASLTCRVLRPMVKPASASGSSWSAQRTCKWRSDGPCRQTTQIGLLVRESGWQLGLRVECARLLRGPCAVREPALIHGQ